LHFFDVVYIIPDLGYGFALGFVPDETGARGMDVVGLGGTVGETAEEGGDGGFLTDIGTGVWGM
jgi:hypothetical protein